MEIEGAIILNIIVFILGLIYGRIIFAVKESKGGFFRTGQKLEKVYTEFFFASIFLLVFNSFNPFSLKSLNPESFDTKAILSLFIPLMLAFAYFVSNAEPRTRKINKSYLMFGFGVVISYIIVDYILKLNTYYVKGVAIYSPVMYLVILFLLIVIQALNYTKNEKTNYIIDVIMFMYLIAIFVGSTVMVISIPIIITVYLVLAIIKKYLLLNIILKNGKRKMSKEDVKQLEKEEKQKNRGIIAITPIITWSTGIVYLLYNYYINYIVL